MPDRHLRYADLVQLLVESHGASVDALSLARKTALHMAAEMGQMSVANTLLLMNADANATDEVKPTSSNYFFTTNRLVQIDYGLLINRYTIASDILYLDSFNHLSVISS